MDRGGVLGMLAEHADPPGDGIERRAEGVREELAIVFRRANQDVEIGLERTEPVGDGVRLVTARCPIFELGGQVMQPGPDIVKDGPAGRTRPIGRAANGVGCSRNDMRACHASGARCN